MKLNSDQIEKSHLFAGRYELVKTIGIGGMGRVCLAKDTLLNHDEVALKVLLPELSKDQEQIHSFFNEAQLNRKINHPNVVRIFDVGQSGETIYYTMEYVEGISLKEKISRGPLPLQDSIRIMREICAGLAAIHEAGILHRDLKPGNVMIEAGGQAKITDFGIASTRASAAMRENDLVGSAEYIAPELWQGKDASIQSDIYALGVMLFEMLSGHLPFKDAEATDIMRQHLCSPIPEITNDSIPSNIKRLCYRLLSKTPGERPSSCFEIIQKLSAGTSTSISITHDDFVAPTVLGGINSKPLYAKVQGNLPDYSTLKKRTNPDSYKIPVNEIRSELSKSSLGVFAQNRVSSGTIGAYNIKEESPVFFQILAAFVTIAFILWFTDTYMVPWEKTLRSSMSTTNGIYFFGNLAICVLGVSILLSSPAAIVAALRPGFMRDRRFVVFWGEICCIMIVATLAIFTWQLFISSDNLIRTVTNNPGSLYISFQKSVETLIYVALFVPRYALEDHSLIFYTCLGFYAIGLFVVFQVNQPGTNIIFAICAILLPLILFIEYQLPVVSKEQVYNLTLQSVVIPIGSHNFSISRYALYCGIFNWSVVLLGVHFLRRIVNLTNGR